MHVTSLAQNQLSIVIGTECSERDAFLEAADIMQVNRQDRREFYHRKGIATTKVHRDTGCYPAVPKMTVHG